MQNNPFFEAIPIRIPLSPPKLRNLSVAEFFIQYESGALPAKLAGRLSGELFSPPQPIRRPCAFRRESAAPFHSPQCPGGRLAGPGIHLLSGTVDPEMKKRIPLYPLFPTLGAGRKKR